jgi:NAD kinase
MDATDHKIVLVTRQTRVQELLARFNTIEQVRFHVEHLHADFSDYEREHKTYLAALAAAEAVLSRFGRVHRLDRGFLPNYLFSPDALVVVLGQDGLVANTLKYLKNAQPVIGVNPEPARWDGVLLPFQVKDLAAIVPDALAGNRTLRRVSMAVARLADGQELHAVNDLFIGPRSHVSARYEIRLGTTVETHSSSGLIVSTGLGSTGWFQSLLAGAAGIASGHRLDDGVQQMRGHGFPWEAQHLQFVVREPFPSRNTQADLVFGRITPNQPLNLISAMPGNGVIFSDGVEADYLEFNAGMNASISLAERYGQLVG